MLCEDAMRFLCFGYGLALRSFHIAVACGIY